jgi:hypothetical protein
LANSQLFKQAHSSTALEGGVSTAIHKAMINKRGYVTEQSPHGLFNRFRIPGPGIGQECAAFSEEGYHDGTAQ